MPPRSARTINRPRLLELLQEGLQYKLTLINAPAGFGKTTLIAEWLHSIELKSSWISLEAGDNDPARFWNYITSAIDLVYPGFKRKIRSVPLQTVDDAFVVTLLNMLDRLKHPLILVLDDFHVIENPAILKSFSYLISYIPAHVHIYITSRIDLKFPSARLE